MIYIAVSIAKAETLAMKFLDDRTWLFISRFLGIYPIYKTYKPWVSPSVLGVYKSAKLVEMGLYSDISICTPLWECIAHSSISLTQHCVENTQCKGFEGPS